MSIILYLFETEKIQIFSMKLYEKIYENPIKIHNHCGERGAVNLVPPIISLEFIYNSLLKSNFHTSTHLKLTKNKKIRFPKINS